MQKARKKLGFGLIMLGMLFLANFDIAVIDFLPDLFGYLLISAGISQLAYLSPKFEQSQVYFKRMIWVGLAKLVSIIWLFMFTNDLERPVGFLLFTFIFAIVDFIILVPAFNNFFEGILHVSTKFDGEAAFVTKRNSRFSITDKIKRNTILP